MNNNNHKSSNSNIPYQSDYFPIGLLILSDTKTSQHFNLLSINQLALSFLHIPPHSKDILADFLTSIKQFKQSFFKKNTQMTLFDFLLSNKRSKEQGLIKSMCFKFNEEIICVKIKRKSTEMYISIDNLTDDKANIKEMLIGSIAKNFLMTINHELRNYLCALITTAGETEALLDPRDFLILTSSAHLIQKIVKVYILFTKISFDEIKGNKLKLINTHDFNHWFRHTHLKFHRIFLYKNIHMRPFESTKKISARTDFHYMKDLLFVLFIFLYYKVSDNGTITIDIDYISQSSCKITFSHDNIAHNSVIAKDVTFEDEGRMNETQLKKSVMTLDILEYLLMNICKYINYHCEIYHNTYKKTPNGITSNLQRKLLTLTLNDIFFDDSSSYFNDTSNNNNNDNSNDNNDPTQLQLNKINNKCNEDNDISMYLEQLSNRNGTIIDFQFEKKNTYDQSKIKDNSIKENHRRSVNVVSMTDNKNLPSNILYVPNPFNTESDKNKDIKENKKILEKVKQISKKRISPHKNNIIKNCSNIADNPFALLNSDFDSSETVDEISFENNHNIIQQPRLSLYSLQYQQQQLVSKSPSLLLSPTDLLSSSISIDHSYTKPFNINDDNTILGKCTEDTAIWNDSISNKIFSIYGTEENVIKILGNIDLNPNNQSSIAPTLSIFQPQSQPSPNSDCNCKDILVVDDERPIAHSMIKILQSQNCETDYCKDGRDCIDKIRAKATCNCDKKYYKLILLDVYMANWGGIITCYKINELIQEKVISPNVKVVFISGHKMKDLHLPDYHFIKGFYQKPVNRATLNKIIEEFYYVKELCKV